VTTDAANQRQIMLIDEANAAEKRKPNPDARLIAVRERFKPNRLDCGEKP
jgi:hypothetical protein